MALSLVAYADIKWYVKDNQEKTHIFCGNCYGSDLLKKQCIL